MHKLRGTILRGQADDHKNLWLTERKRITKQIAESHKMSCCNKILLYYTYEEKVNKLLG